MSVRRDPKYVGVAGYDGWEEREFVANERNPYIGGLTDDSSRLEEKVASMKLEEVQNELVRLYRLDPALNPIRSPVMQRAFDTGYGETRDEYSPTIAYEELVRKMRETAPYTVNYGWKKRYNAMVGILNGNRLAGPTHIRNNAYGLVLKMVASGEYNLARALDLEAEASLDQKE